jgi:hypothetical protein
MARTKKIIADATNVAHHISIGLLSTICPMSLVDEVLKQFNKASKRISVMPANLVVYFVMAMALWRDPPVEEVMKIVSTGLTFFKNGELANNYKVSKSTISMARSRLGAEVMRELANRVLKPLGKEGSTGCWYKGLRLMAIDGSSFTLSDDTAVAEYYGYPSSSRGDTAFPHARVLSLVETGTHAIVASTIGPYEKSEQYLMGELLAQDKLKSDMLLLADRNFYGYPLWKKATSTGAKLVWRIKNNLRLPVEKRLSDRSYLSTVYDSRDKKGSKGIKVRVIQYGLREKRRKVGEEVYRIITNIMDDKLAPAAELAELYHERWEIETIFGELKSSMKGSSTLIRSRTPELVEQEIWGFLLTHFAVRKMMADVAEQKGLDTDRLSFKGSVHIIRRMVPQIAASSPKGEENTDK